MRAAIDASALLALLLKEPGSELVMAALFADSCITAVNLAEVCARYVLRGADEAVVRGLRRRVPIDVVPVDEELGVLSALMIPHTKPQGLSLGDRMCLALAKREGLPALTADQRWSEIADAVGVEVRQIRRTRDA